MKPDNRGSWSLVGLLAAVAVVGLLAFFLFGRSGGPSSVKSDSQLVDQSSKKQTVYGKSMDTAKGVDCAERMRQIRTAIQMYRDTNTDGTNPPTLKDAGLSVGSDYFKCPVSGQPYNYDPSGGTVTCPYPGHAGF